MLVPVLTVVLLLLLQPACLLYTRALMEQAAGEAVRVLATSPMSEEGSKECRNYVLRRLDAVPALPIFHDGGREDWEVRTSGGKNAKNVSVEVVGYARPLPIVGAASGMLGKLEDGKVRLRVYASSDMRPGWLRGSYDTWVKMWE